MTRSLTETRPAAIQLRASLREPRPAFDRTRSRVLSGRSPGGSLRAVMCGADYDSRPMKRVILVVLMLVACGKETQAPVPVAKTAPVAKSPSPLAPLPAARGEGNYGKAVDWVRSAPAFHFDITIGDVKASGDLTRARVDEERLQFKAKADEWVAQRH